MSFLELATIVKPFKSIVIGDVDYPRKGPKKGPECKSMRQASKDGYYVSLKCDAEIPRKTYKILSTSKKYGFLFNSIFCNECSHHVTPPKEKDPVCLVRQSYIGDQITGDIDKIKYTHSETKKLRNKLRDYCVADTSDKKSCKKIDAILATKIKKLKEKIDNNIPGWVVAAVLLGGAAIIGTIVGVGIWLTGRGSGSGPSRPSRPQPKPERPNPAWRRGMELPAEKKPAAKKPKPLKIDPNQPVGSDSEAAAARKRAKAARRGRHVVVTGDQRSPKKNRSKRGKNRGKKMVILKPNAMDSIISASTPSFMVSARQIAAIISSRIPASKPVGERTLSDLATPVFVGAIGLVMSRVKIPGASKFMQRVFAR